MFSLHTLLKDQNKRRLENEKSKIWTWNGDNSKSKKTHHIYFSVILWSSPKACPLYGKSGPSGSAPSGWGYHGDVGCQGRVVSVGISQSSGHIVTGQFHRAGQVSLWIKYNHKRIFQQWMTDFTQTKFDVSFCNANSNKRTIIWKALYLVRILFKIWRDLNTCTYNI